MQNDMPSNVFVGTPTHICKRYCADKFVKAVTDYADACKHLIVCNSKGDAHAYYSEYKKVTDIVFSNDRKVYYHFILPDSHFNKEHSTHLRICKSMNVIRRVFLSSGKKYFLSLEADVLLGYDTIQSMLYRMNEHQLDVLHSNCYPGFNKSKEFTLTDRLTLGCTLVKRKVLEDIAFRYDESLLACYHDGFFAIDCHNAGYKMGYDPSIVVEHVSNGQQRGWECLPLIEQR